MEERNATVLHKKRSKLGPITLGGSPELHRFKLHLFSMTVVPRRNKINFDSNANKDSQLPSQWLMTFDGRH